MATRSDQLRRSERDELALRFGKNLRATRKRAGLSQEAVSFRAELHRTEISLLERGERLPRVDTMLRLSSALSASPMDLLDGMSWEAPIQSEGRFKVGQGKDDERKATS